MNLEVFLRFPRQAFFSWLCVCLLAAVVRAEPGLHFEPLYGLLSQRFAAPSHQAAFGAGQPLWSGPARTPISYQAAVDSSGMAHYGRRVSGFAEGPTVAVALDDYLRMEYQARHRQLWHQQVRRDFRSTASQQRQRGGRRFEWTVPFSAPKPLRRFIGDEGPSLALNGSRTIIISGKSQWTDGEVQTSFGRSSKFPSLGIEQESDFTVEGKVGELISVRIDQDTQNLGSAFSSSLGDQLSNQIKLDYDGEEDSIFQEVQAGNTTLELPNTRFIGFRQKNKGLFGIRAKGQVGPLAFTAVASHEKSKSNRQTFKGGAAIDTLQLRDYQYLRNTYFFLHEFYRAHLTDFRSLSEGGQFGPENSVDISRLEVYINDFNTRNDAELFARPGTAWVDRSDSLSAVECFDAAGNRLRNSGCFEEGTWHRLDPDDDYSVVAQAGFIILNRSVSDPYAMAVHFKTNAPDFDGTLQQETARLKAGAESDSLHLKLIKARNPRPGFPTWNLEWKNVYRIASGFSTGRRFDPKTLQVDIAKEVPGQEDQLSQQGRSFLQILGLDERGKDPGSAPDRVIDADYIGLDDSRGHLIFPDQRPFDPRSDEYRDLLNEPVPAIYDEQQRRAQLEASRYKILVRAASSEQRIRLGGVFGNVRPETVEVQLNGRPLTPNTDYRVDFSGSVTFIGSVAQEVADPGADLEISFESEDIFNIGSQQKTLLGLRTEYEFWGGDGRVGSTMIYNNERAGSNERVQVGNEPKRTVIWNLDVRARREVPILTRVVDMLPLVKTAVPSEVTLDAEVAQSRPNLNTKGRGYIDDFEASEGAKNLVVNRTRWAPASAPRRFSAENRAPLIWYNPYDGVLRTDIWPNQEEQVEAQNRRTDILALKLLPSLEATESWGGIALAFSTVSDLSESKFLELWVRGREGTLHVNLGDQIDEDYIANGRLDTEDEPYPGQAAGDGLVSREEDLGIDGRNDEAELNFYLRRRDAAFDTTRSLAERKQAFAALYPDPDSRRPNRSPDDPEGDNWQYDSQRNKHDYSHINGTENNKKDVESGDRPDTEDLNNNGVLDRRNSYYHYEVDLSSSHYEVAGTQSKGWRQLRVPLFGPHVERVGLPDSTRIEYARLILSSGPQTAVADTVLAEIALMEVVANKWQEDEVVRLDERFPLGDREALDVTVIGTDKSQSYRPPPGVKIRRNVQSRTREREQSLVLAYENLEPGHQMSATRILTRSANYTSYERLRMYVYGDSSGTIEYAHGDSSDLVLFVRFGVDSTNYYETISPIFPGWTGGRQGWKGNQVDVDLPVISQLKALLQSGQADTTTGEFYYTYRVMDPHGAPLDGKSLIDQRELEALRAAGYDPHVERFSLDQVYARSGRRSGEQAIYRVRGNPSMQSIKQLSIGLRNRATNRAYSGRIFLDELRLDEARNDPGLAAYAQLNTKLADFANLGGNVLWRQENFRSFTGQGGNSTDREAALSVSTNAQKLLPSSWGFLIPIKVNLSRSTSLPRFGPGSDVELTAEEKLAQQAVRTKEFYDVSISRRQGKNFFLRWTLDQMNLRLSHSREHSSDPVRPINEREAQTLNFNYSMPLPKPELRIMRWLPELAPKGWRRLEFRPLPTSLTYAVNGSRRISQRLRRGDDEITAQEDFTLAETYASKLNPLSGLSANYNLKIDRDLRKKFAPAKRSFGREVGRRQTADLGFSLRLVSWLDQNYTFKANYDEQNDPSQRRGVAPIDSISGLPFNTLEIRNQNDLSARLNFKIPTLLKNLGKAPGQSRQVQQRDDRNRNRNRNIDDDQPTRLKSSDPSAGQSRQARQRDGRDRDRNRNPNLDEDAPPSKEEQSKAKPPQGPNIFRRLAGWTGRLVEPVNASWRRNTNSRHFNLLQRPSLSYQLGLTDSLQVRQVTQGLTLQDNWSHTSSFEAGSGMRLPFGISVKVNSKEQTTQRSGASQQRLRLRNERTYPRVSLSWGRADRIPLIKRVINSAQVNASFETSEVSEGEGSLAPGRLLSEETKNEFRASWNGRWRWGPTTTIERVISTSESRDFEPTGEDSGAQPLRGTRDREQITTTFKITHNLKPRRLPFIGRLKSDVTLNLEQRFEAETRSIATGAEDRVPSSQENRWRTQLSMTYNFSTNFRGEGRIRIENNKDHLKDKTQKIREVRLSGTFFLR